MIELKHLSKTFETAGGRVDALKDVSLTIPDGDVYGNILSSKEHITILVIF